MTAPIYFAIGDVHGEATKLAALHDTILERILFEKAPARIVHLGDYVDRGPDSRGVIQRIMGLEALLASNPDVEVISLMGNHEQMMLDAYDAPGEPTSWLTQGGAEAVRSYLDAADVGETNWRDAIPSSHISWMRRLLPIYRDETRKLVFVHAGIEPSSFPNEDDRVYLWTRSDRFFDNDKWPERAELDGLTVIHGHTPKTFEPEIDPHRINIDTGACFGGPLTAVMLKENEKPVFLRAR